MAEGSEVQRPPRRRRAKPAPERVEREATRRVVMRRVRVVVLAEDADPSSVDKAAEVLEAWVVCGTFSGTKTQAIEAFAGKPGSPDAIIGVFKAPSETAFKGGVIYSAPPAPKVERTLFED